MKTMASVLFLAAFLLGPIVWLNLQPNRYSGGRSADLSHRQDRNASAVGQMLGEFRTGISDILLLKTDACMHGGVAYLPHGAEDEKAAPHEESREGPVDSDGHSGIPTIVPSADLDFRGIIGDWERQVKPWQNPDLHAPHSNGKEVLPWFRIATLSDPYNIRVYVMGSFTLSQLDPGQAVAYVEEGLKHNPDSFQLQYELGRLAFKQARLSLRPAQDFRKPDPDQLPAFLTALDYFAQSAQHGLKQRPHGNVNDNPDWTQSQENDVWAAFRMAALSEFYYRDPAAAKKLATKILRIAGEDESGTLQSILTKPASQSQAGRR